MIRLDSSATASTTTTTKLSRHELKVLLHSYIRDQTAEQLLDRYSEKDAEQFISLKEKLITMVEGAIEDRQ